MKLPSASRRITLVSRPAPLRFLPISSTIRRSTSSKGNRGIKRRASSSSFISSGSIEFDHLHAALDRHAHGLFGDAIMREHIELAGIGRAAMTAHRWHDEDIRAKSLQFLADRSDDDVVIRDPSAARAYGDGHAWP